MYAIRRIYFKSHNSLYETNKLDNILQIKVLQ
jgi:hypothetical protein